MKIAIVGAGIAGITQLQMLSGIRGSYEKDDEIVSIIISSALKSALVTRSVSPL